MPWDLEAARITALPDDAFYIPNFISKEEEQILLQKVSLTISYLQLSAMYRSKYCIHPAQI
jgi:hypothetical protein